MGRSSSVIGGGGWNDESLTGEIPQPHFGCLALLHFRERTPAPPLVEFNFHASSTMRVCCLHCDDSVDASQQLPSLTTQVFALQIICLTSRSLILMKGKQTSLGMIVWRPLRGTEDDSFSRDDLV